LIYIRLKELAEAKQLSKNQVARQTGLDIGMVRRYWDNDSSVVSLSALDALCEYFECEPCDLLKRIPDDPKSA
jgi:putative transcriptional regulator